MVLPQQTLVESAANSSDICLAGEFSCKKTGSRTIVFNANVNMNLTQAEFGLAVTIAKTGFTSSVLALNMMRMAIMTWTLKLWSFNAQSIDNQREGVGWVEDRISFYFELTFSLR